MNVIAINGERGNEFNIMQGWIYERVCREEQEGRNAIMICYSQKIDGQVESE